MLARFLAENFSMGRLIARRGWRVALSPYACNTVVTDSGFGEMLRHEVHWQRLERSCRPMHRFMSVVTWPLPLSCFCCFPIQA